MKIKIELILLFFTLIAASCTNNISEERGVSRQGAAWSLVWEENFDGVNLDTTRFNVIQRGQSDWNNTMSNYPDCIEVKDGKLILRGILNNGKDPKDRSKYLTGGVDTQGKFAFDYGKIEICAKLDEMQGAWPALWMMGDKPIHGGWPYDGEIDVMEHLNHDGYVYQTVHSEYVDVIGEKDNPPHHTTYQINNKEYNVYGVEWYPDSLVFTVNGNRSFTYPKIDEKGVAQWPFDHPYYFMLDMQLGGAWVGNIDDSKLPIEMSIDWVKVYKSNSN